MTKALNKLDQGIPKNNKVRILAKGKGNGRISISPFDPVPEPVNLSRLKAEIMKRWPMTSLLDILKEADLRVNFTDLLKHLHQERSLVKICYRRGLSYVYTVWGQMQG